jgi:hypothetical protein
MRLEKSPYSALRGPELGIAPAGNCLNGFGFRNGINPYFDRFLASLPYGSVQGENHPRTGHVGSSYSGYLRGGKDPSGGATLIACIAPFGQWERRQGGREHRGVRTKRFTCVRDLTGPWLLFDNQAEPLQTRNLVNPPDRARVRTQLETMLSEET